VSKAAVSRYVWRAGNTPRVRLLQRTTRRLSLTEEGQVFYARSKELLGGGRGGRGRNHLAQRSPSGLLRINAPVTFGIRHLAPLWACSAAVTPRVSLDVTLADRVVDLVEEGYDVAIRIATLRVPR